MYTVALMILTVAVVAYSIKEHIAWLKRVEAAKEKQLKRETERHAKMQGKTV